MKNKINSLEKVEQIVENFINGNLSWVKNELCNNLSLLAQVQIHLKEINEQEAERFINWIAMW